MFGRMFGSGAPNIKRDVRTSVSDLKSISSEAPEILIPTELRVIDPALAEINKERSMILSESSQAAYYNELRMYFSETMVKTLDIGSGYVAITQGEEGTIERFLFDAISSIYSGVSMSMASVEVTQCYLDVQYRVNFLEKTRVLGNTLDEVESLGEEVARLLIRAHLSAEKELSSLQAKRDIESIIKFMVSSNPPLVGDIKTAVLLASAVLNSEGSDLELKAQQSEPKDQKNSHYSQTTGVSIDGYKSLLGKHASDDSVSRYEQKNKSQIQSNSTSMSDSSQKTALLIEINRIKRKLNLAVDTLNKEIPNAWFDSKLKITKRDKLQELISVLDVSEKSDLDAIKKQVSEYQTKLFKCESDAVIRQGAVSSRIKTLVDDLSKDLENENHSFNRFRK